jgi:PAS domain S-box-containing protein
LTNPIVHNIRIIYGNSSKVITVTKKSDIFRMIVNEANVGMAIGQRRADGVLDHFMEVNNELCRILGYTRDELLKLTPHDIVPVERHIGYRPIKAGETTDYETERLAKDGKRVPVELRSRVFKVDDTEYALVVLKDISKQKKMEKELQQYSMKLEEMVDERTRQLTEAHRRLVRTEKLAAIGQLASGIAHDMGTPLTVITIVADYLKEKLVDNDEIVTTQLARLARQAKIANRIARDLLDFARAREPEFEEMHLSGAINEALNRVDIPESVDLELHMREGLPKVSIDLDQIMRVFSNILRNAIQAMPDGGTIAIRTSYDNKFVLIEIIDSGVGIPAHNMKNIFEPLFTTRSKQGSTGLGLAICKSIIEAHNGVIEVDSQEGAGATVTIKFPV